MLPVAASLSVILKTHVCVFETEVSDILCLLGGTESSAVYRKLGVFLLERNKLSCEGDNARSCCECEYAVFVSRRLYAVYVYERFFVIRNCLECIVAVCGGGKLKCTESLGRSVNDVVDGVRNGLDAEISFGLAVLEEEYLLAGYVALIYNLANLAACKDCDSVAAYGCVS